MSPRIVIVWLAVLLTVMTVAEAADSTPPDRAADPRLEWWREARFGLFIHWGLYAIPAGTWGEETGHGEWILHTARIPVAEYERLTTRFNPVAFDADAWARLAREAGMGYMVITTKHHDGFCLFDSAHTEHDVMSTPFRRDIMQELSDACRRENLRMGWYHSIMDWHHPDYLPRRSWETRSADGADYDRYVQHLYRQVRELLTKYGPIGVMWFDGEWEGTWTHEHGLALYDLCRQLQPDIIVNNRVDKGRGGMAGMTADAKYAGDYGTPEQEVPPTGLPGVDWESCMTMNRHWGYNRQDDDWKSAPVLIRTLVDIASKGGNFLLNVGPTADGTFPEPCVERLRAIGRWMDVNGAAIHGTTASPFGALPWGRCTVRVGDERANEPSTVYLHVFDWPTDGRLVLEGFGSDATNAALLAEPGTPLPVTRHGTDVAITVPPDAPDSVCSVVAIEVTGRPIVYRRPDILADASIFVRPLAVKLVTTSPTLTIRYTLDDTEPTVASAVYRTPIEITETTTVRARTFDAGRPVSAVSDATFVRVDPAPAVDAPRAVPGLECATFEGDFDALPDFDGLVSTARGAVSTIAETPGIRRTDVARRLTGFIEVPRDDVYTFSLVSDDGSRLLIDGGIVVDNDGLHGPQEQRGVTALGKGLHPIVIEHFNKTGGAVLEVWWAPVGDKLQLVTEDVLSHREY